MFVTLIQDLVPLIEDPDWAQKILDWVGNQANNLINQFFTDALSGVSVGLLLALAEWLGKLIPGPGWVLGVIKKRKWGRVRFH